MITITETTEENLSSLLSFHQKFKLHLCWTLGWLQDQHNHSLQTLLTEMATEFYPSFLNLWFVHWFLLMPTELKHQAKRKSLFKSPVAYPSYFLIE